MPIEPKIIAEFPKCPICGSIKRVSEMGCAELKEKGKIPKDTFTKMRAEAVPLEQPSFAGVGVDCIVNYFDACGNCGLERVTKSEIIKALVQMQPPPSLGFRPPTFKH